MDLSVVVPAYNEVDRLGPTLDALASFQRGSDLESEIIVVDDGSTDDTGTVARSHPAAADLTVICLPANMGKGKAVAAGMSAARGLHRAYLDADGATPASQLAPLYESVSARPRRVAIGSIKVPGAIVTRPQPLSRRVGSWVGNRIIQAAVLPGIRDTQRGAKIFPAELADEIFPRLQIRGWGFDVEVLAMARAAGYDIVEVPIVWAHQGGGKIRSSAYLRTLGEVLVVRRRVRNGALTPGGSPTPRRLATGLAPLRQQRSR